MICHSFALSGEEGSAFSQNNLLTEQAGAVLQDPSEPQVTVAPPFIV